MRSFRQRLAELEALERAQQPEVLAFLCVRSEDFARLDQPEVLARYGLASTAQLPAKVYIGFCTCAWDSDGRSCPVCEGDDDGQSL